MVTTSTDGPATEVGAPRPGRTIERPRGLPGGRAIVGGLLVALAGVGTFASWQQSSGAPDQSYAVAARALRPGEAVTAADVRLEPIELPTSVAESAFTDAAQLDGRVALGPVGEGELVQLGQVSDQDEGVAAAELSFSIERDRAVDGRLRSGDLVDVFVTYDDRTATVAEAMQLVDVRETRSGSFDSSGELTVTLAITDPGQRVSLIQAARSGDVTLVRSTHLSHGGSSRSATATSDTASTLTTEGLDPSSGPTPPPAGAGG